MIGGTRARKREAPAVISPLGAGRFRRGGLWRRFALGRFLLVVAGQKRRQAAALQNGLGAGFAVEACAMRDGAGDARFALSCYATRIDERRSEAALAFTLALTNGNHVCGGAKHFGVRRTFTRTAAAFPKRPALKNSSSAKRLRGRHSERSEESHPVVFHPGRCVGRLFVLRWFVARFFVVLVRARERG